MNSGDSIPLATYRLQLNHKFTFAQATAIVPYLSSLGVSHCYISPCLKARPGSMHGYDIVDHNSLNPEIGSPEDFDGFVNALHQHGMGLILDIVPNHMGVMGSDNAWWLDVLENGEASLYANYFDIDWHPLKQELHGKVLIPVLGDHYGAVLESGGLRLIFRPDRGEFNVSYGDHRFPVNPREYPRILQQCAASLIGALGADNPDLLEFQSLITAFGHLPSRQDADRDRIIERNRDKEIHKRRLAELCGRSARIAACIQHAIDLINGDPSDPSSFEQLHELIKAQAFRLANWRVAADDINYRRFFDTNDLAGICVENEAVFEATHRLILTLVAQGKVNGLRIDHPDGLYDPARYFERLNRGIVEAINRLQKHTPPGDGPPAYVVIEKILTGLERLPEDWPVSGTTGYDFANLVNGLFVDSASAVRMQHIYRNFIDEEIDVDDLAYRCRKLIVQVALASELNVLASKLSRIALSKRRTCDFTLNGLADALTEVVASFPVYRTYINSSHISEMDRFYIRSAITAAKERSPAADTTIFDFVEEVLLTHIAEGQDFAYRNVVTSFAMKFQQFTGPVMAKGLEDTAFYRYNRLVSLNEVGGDLNRFGTSIADFHIANQERMRDWPHTMLATSTHDSKRSEDVRARLNLLSEIPVFWRTKVREWKRFNRSHRRLVNDRPAPTPNDEYLLYQTLLGVWPLEPLRQKGDWENFANRIQAYMLKAMREAKQNTSWINPNAEYEAAVASFVRALLMPGDKNRFLADFLPLQGALARMGLWSSLSQTLLKLTSPGVPDIYQGNDFWDFSLVDPDNRRPVDYISRRESFETMRSWGNAPDLPTVRRLLENPNDGKLKQYLIWKTLCLRHHEADLFQLGEYIPLAVEGTKADHVVAFSRKHQSRSALIVVPRLIAGLFGKGDTSIAPLGPSIWQATQAWLPSPAGPREYRNLLTGEVLHPEESDSGQCLSLSKIFAEFPVALLLSS